MKEDNTIGDLFRKNLEYVEVIPGPAVKTNLMRKLARKEFLNFNPGKFNVFYLSAITGVVFIASLIFSGNNDIIVKKTEPVSINAEWENIKAIEIASIGTSVENANSFTLKNVSEIKPPSEPLKSNDTIFLQTKSTPVPPLERIMVPISKNDIFGDHNPSGKTLKSKVLNTVDAIAPVSQSGCAPLKVQFRNTADSYDSCLWTFGDGGFSNKNDPEWIYDIDGEYKVGLQIFSGGRSFTATSIVNVYPKPKAHFEYFPENAIIPKDRIRFLNYSSNAGHFSWDFGDGSISELFEPDHAYQKPGNYDVRLIAFSSQGCSDTLIVTNAFSASEYFIEFPNAFIPNQGGPSGGYFSSKTDEAAQVFHPSGSGISEYHLKIFSKLGKLIFESYDINSGWDGYNKGQICEPGVYIWKVRGKFRNGEPFIKMGDVTLLKF